MRWKRECTSTPSVGYFTCLSIDTEYKGCTHPNNQLRCFLPKGAYALWLFLLRIFLLLTVICLFVSLQVLEHALHDLYRLLKMTLTVEKEEMVKVHVQLSLDELDSITREFLFPKQTLTKHIYVADAPPNWTWCLVSTVCTGASKKPHPVTGLLKP